MHCRGCPSLNAVVVAGLLAQFVAFHTTLAQNPVASAADWPVYNRSFSGERHSPLRRLTPANVVRLRRVCTFDTKEHVGFQTGPVVVGGVMYFTTDTMTYAIDAATCATKWQQRTGQAPTYLGAHRGVAYDDGRLFRGAGVNHGRQYVAAAAGMKSPIWPVSHQSARIVVYGLR